MLNLSTYDTISVPWQSQAPIKSNDDFAFESITFDAYSTWQLVKWAYFSLDFDHLI